MAEEAPPSSPHTTQQRKGIVHLPPNPSHCPAHARHWPIPSIPNPNSKHRINRSFTFNFFCSQPRSTNRVFKPHSPAFNETFSFVFFGNPNSLCSVLVTQTSSYSSFFSPFTCSASDLSVQQLFEPGRCARDSGQLPRSATSFPIILLVL
jgi:hypothetical protein